MKKAKYIGIVFDNYTPQVESQLTRDFIAIKYVYKMNDVVACCSQPQVVQKVLSALGISVNDSLELAETAFVYKTQKSWPEVYEECKTRIDRDLFVPSSTSKLVSNPEATGYPLPQWGRPYVGDIHRMRYHPNGFGPPDPAIKLLWG